MKDFIFTYKEKTKYKPLELHTKISLSKDVNDIGIDAKRALSIFTKEFGSLKKNEIISIQEIDLEGNPIGEPIKPIGETSILPSAY